MEFFLLELRNVADGDIDRAVVLDLAVSHLDRRCFAILDDYDVGRDVSRSDDVTTVSSLLASSGAV